MNLNLLILLVGFVCLLIVQADENNNQQQNQDVQKVQQPIGLQRPHGRLAARKSVEASPGQHAEAVLHPRRRRLNERKQEHAGKAGHRAGRRAANGKHANHPNGAHRGPHQSSNPPKPAK